MLKLRHRLTAVVGVAAFAALSTVALAVPASASTSATANENLQLSAGSLSITNTALSATLSGSMFGAVPGVLAQTQLNDSSGLGAGWNATVGSSYFVYTGTWSGTGPALGNASGSAAFTGRADGDTYTVTVTSSTGTYTTFNWTSSDPTDIAGGTGVQAINGTPQAVGTTGLTITFGAGTTYAPTDVYSIKAGSQPETALTLLTSNFSAVAVTGTNSPVPVAANNASVISAGGAGVKFVSAAPQTGMGSYTVVPGVSFAPDSSSWAGVTYAATETYSIITGP